MYFKLFLKKYFQITNAPVKNDFIGEIDSNGVQIYLMKKYATYDLREFRHFFSQDITFFFNKQDRLIFFIFFVTRYFLV